MVSYNEEQGTNKYGRRRHPNEKIYEQFKNDLERKVWPPPKAYETREDEIVSILREIRRTLLYQESLLIFIAVIILFIYIAILFK